MAGPSPSTRPDEHPVCFLHVPKAAGSSIRHAIETALGPGSMAPKGWDMSALGGFTDLERLTPDMRRLTVASDADADALAGYRAVCGHFRLGTLLRVAPPSSIATVLREPRARILSHYAFIRLTPGLSDLLRPLDFVAHAQRPLEDFLSQPAMAAAVDNATCRLLLGPDERVPPAGFIAPAAVAGVARDAVARLETLGFVGILELGDATWRGLSRMLGVALAHARVNVTARDGTLAAELPPLTAIAGRALELLDERSAADAIVYRWAVERAGADPVRLGESAFATQLVRLGDLAGASAAQLAEHRRETRRLGGELDRHRRWLADIQPSLSWRMTAPLRRAKRRLR